MQELELKSLVRGRVLLPGEEGYDAERAGWNTIVEHRPAMIVVAAGPEDVAAAVRYTASEGVPVAVQATGHGPDRCGREGGNRVTRGRFLRPGVPGRVHA